MRAFRIAFALFAIVTAASATAEPAKLTIGSPFPVLDADTLAGPRATLPADRHGAAFVAIFGFSRNAGEAAAKWSHALHTALPATIAVYAVADLSHVPGIVRGFAVAGIRNEASPVQPEHRDHVLLLTRANAWGQIVPPGAADDAVIVAVDDAGTVVDVERLAYDETSAAALARRINLATESK
jgi:hypothetical protein